MLRIIIWREFLANIITLRFLLGLTICTGLISLKHVGARAKLHTSPRRLSARRGCKYR